MTETAARDEIAIEALDQRYAALRLAAPDELARVRGSIERMGMLHPVLVATAIEPPRLVLVDGFKRVRVATDRGERAVWATRATLESNGPMIPRTWGSPTRSEMLRPPSFGSWTPRTASSRELTSTVKPSRTGLRLTKNLTPFSAGLPAWPSSPESGRSTPILIVLLFAEPPPLQPVSDRRQATARQAMVLGGKRTRRLSPCALRCAADAATPQNLYSWSLSAES